jgi:hypothetical protein
MKKRFSKYFAVFMILNLLFEIVSPTVALALTNGPVQPELIGFQPAANSEMVDLFSGDFNYNIPLMDIDGYPVNISYRAGQNMESEASWVGLGWSLNPGVMNRMMRGLPDDFDGDVVNTLTNIRENLTIGVGAQLRHIGGASFGFQNLGLTASLNSSFGATINYNNYTGFFLELQLDHSASLGASLGYAFFTPLAGSVSMGKGMKISTLDGSTTTNYYAYGYTLLNELRQGGLGVFGWLYPPNQIVNSAQYTNGTVQNSRSGLTYDLYAQTTSSKSGAGFLLSPYSDLSHSKSALVPTTALAFPPRINHSFKGVSSSLSFGAGIYACSPIPWTPWITIEEGDFLNLTKYQSNTKLMNPSKSFNAYGYMNLENADEYSLMDYSRYKDGVYMKKAPNGSFANLNVDLFSSSAQGMTSTFRAFRSDYGVVHDPKVGGSEKGFNVHIAMGGPLLFYLEGELGINAGFSTDGNWSASDMARNLKFYKPNPTSLQDRFYEKFYFKEHGEPTQVDQSFEGSGGGQSPNRPPLNRVGNDFLAQSPIGGGRRTTRAIRNTHISYLHAGEAAQRALVKNIKDFSKNQFTLSPSTREFQNFTTQPRNGFNNLSGIDHHLSELTVTKPDGSRYVYGIPVYNKLTKNVTFNASDYDVNGTLGIPSPNPLSRSHYLKMVEYTASEIGVGNTRGVDNYYNHMEIPPYAQSFLLTAIISPDYVDLTDNGPTQDDLGTYVVFNYTHTNDYQWRSPYCAKATSSNLENLAGGTNGAHLAEMLKSNDLDDKGTYEYGIRDNWYLHSIETKNKVAEFEISQRNDNCGVLTEDGGVDAGSSYKLDRIRLFTKEEKINAQLTGGTANPLKTVNFKYDYSLCPGVYNGTSGKLTLNGIYFSYGSSDKSAMSPYIFTYADNDHDNNMEANPSYDPRATDRWGNYKPNDPIGNLDFPYTEQDQNSANNYAASWNLTGIETPSGAKTNITYEADDYSYVMDEPTGVMLRIAAFDDILDKSPTFDYTTNLPNPGEIYDTYEALIDLERLNTGIPTTLSQSAANSIVSQTMFPKKKQLFLRCKTKIAFSGMYANAINKDCWEYVPCYSKISASGIINKNGSDNTYTKNGQTYYKYAWVRLKGVEIVPGEQDLVNPIARAGWEMCRTHLPEIAYPGSRPNSSITSHNPLQTIIDLGVAMGVAISDHKEGMTRAQNKRFKRRGYCRELDYTDSWARAYIPGKKKIGGGYRVKNIITTDNWAATGVGETSTTYGQEYDYTTATSSSEIISSGVASYEPLLGGDENSLHQPFVYDFDKSFAPNDHYFQDGPYLEALYPPAFVGYSKITVKNIDHEYSNGTSYPDKVCNVGKTVYEFYTAKEFPTIEKRTYFSKIPMDNEPIDEYTIPDFIFDREYATQGFAVKLNDMHGKLKSIKVYGEDNFSAPYAGTSFYYKSSLVNSNGGSELLQDAKVIDQDLNISSQVISRDMDVTNDLRSSTNYAMNISMMATVKWSICNPFGKFDFDLSLGSHLLELNTASCTKVIQQYGILDKVESFNNKATTVVENLLRDNKTGEVVLTKVTNNFDQPVYTFNYPAYWINKGMGHKYDRQGLSYLIDHSIQVPVWNGLGDLNPATLSNFLHLGDEVFLYKEISGNKIGGRFWIVENPLNPNLWRFMDANGVILTLQHPDLVNNNENFIVKVDRPIERNTQSYKIANVVTLHNPLTNIQGGTLPILHKDVVDASAIEYCQLWDYFQGNTVGQRGVTLPQNFSPRDRQYSGNPLINPYSANVEGCWRPWKSYAYNDKRNYSTIQPNIKNDGLYTTYSPFWQHTATNGWQKINSHDLNYDKWVTMGENSVYSPYGYLLESKDATGIPQAQRYGFNHTLPVLSASTAKACEVGFDSFEEYGNLYTPYSPITSPQILTNDYMGFYREMNTNMTPNSLKPSLTGTQSHAGRNSLDFSTNQSVTLTHGLNNVSWIESPPPPPRCDYMGLLSINKPKYQYQSKYLVSFWVKSKVNSIDYSNVFTFNAQARDPGPMFTQNATIVQHKTAVINGWQKFDFEIDFPAPSINPDNQALFTVAVAPNKPGFYLDDFRIQPYNSNMTCTVYDPISLRPWAQLDDRNFATYIEYDNQGAMVRTKKETVNGVYTLNETRKNTKK